MSHWTFLAGVVAVSAACGGPASGPVTAPPAARSSRVTLTYLGVAGWSLESSAGALLVDPYVTRAPVVDEAAPLDPDEAAIRAFTPARVEAILVGHSHYDHLLDVPSIARRTGARVVGTESTANVALAAGVPPEHVLVAHGGDTFEIGPFKVRAIAALHSLTGQPNVPIPPGPVLPLPAREYGEGGTLQYLVQFEGHTIFFVGTANFIENEVRGLRPDVAVIAVGLRDKIPDYTCRLVHALGRPALVLPNHFDALHEPLRPEHMELTDDRRADLQAFASEVHACAPATRVEVPIQLHAIGL